MVSGTTARNENGIDSVLESIELNDNVGTAVPDYLAKIVKTMAEGNVSDGTKRKQCERHKRPKNCETLVVPRVS